MQWLKQNIDLRRTKFAVLGLMTFFALLVLAGFVTKAKAADKGAPNFLEVPEVQTSSPWTGCWAGVNLGYASQSTEIASAVSFDANDVTYGVGAGCDVQIKGTQLVVGIMGDHDWTKADSMVASFNRSWFAGGRAGLLLSRTTLFYGVVGYTSLDGSVPTGVPFDVNYRGLTIGGGLETALAGHWTLKAEYRYVDLGSDALGGPFSAEHSQHAIRAGVAYRFSGPAAGTK